MTYVFLVTFLKSKNNNLGELLKDLCLRSVSDTHSSLSNTIHNLTGRSLFLCVDIFYDTVPKYFVVKYVAFLLSQ